MSPTCITETHQTLRNGTASPMHTGAGQLTLERRSTAIADDTCDLTTCESLQSRFMSAAGLHGAVGCGWSGLVHGWRAVI
ncbi:unnamed protein product [Nippostrongylus brasiliensis]|uniref:Uncharacterized protein n=1 Tax=Nippostrongylus brasiliensis TaxID=27835 RepID=A0A0N4XZV4_NIPBR|nr:hypothetical protein Q1695_006746 [Nippostrongylus brasiliensis]VDL72341.1 unnamed protein product [Nippostrongylus brasiliensis]